MPKFGAYKSSSAKSNFRRTKTAQSMATKGTRNEYARVKHRLAKQKIREKGVCLGCENDTILQVAGDARNKPMLIAHRSSFFQLQNC